MFEFTLTYQILVLLLMGVQIGFLYQLIRKKSEQPRTNYTNITPPPPFQPNIIPTPFSGQIPK